MTQTLTITKINREDVPAVVHLINIAYRGEAAQKSWTSEGDYITGARTSEDGIRALMVRPDTDNFKCCNAEEHLLGFVCLEKKPSFVYLSFLTVNPAAQTGGIGKHMLAFAETYAQSNRKPAIIITVVNVRHQLIAWYERRGYQLTGKTFPFPAEAGQVRVPIHLVEMKKDILP